MSSDQAPRTGGAELLKIRKKSVFVNPDGWPDAPNKLKRRRTKKEKPVRERGPVLIRTE